MNENNIEKVLESRRAIFNGLKQDRLGTYYNTVNTHIKVVNKEFNLRRNLYISMGGITLLVIIFNTFWSSLNIGIIISTLFSTIGLDLAGIKFDYKNVDKLRKERNNIIDNLNISITIIDNEFGKSISELQRNPVQSLYKINDMLSALEPLLDLSRYNPDYPFVIKSVIEELKRRSEKDITKYPLN